MDTAGACPSTGATTADECRRRADARCCCCSCCCVIVVDVSRAAMMPDEDPFSFSSSATSSTTASEAHGFASLLVIAANDDEDEGLKFRPRCGRGSHSSSPMSTSSGIVGAGAVFRLRGLVVFAFSLRDCKRDSAPPILSVAASLHRPRSWIAAASPSPPCAACDGIFNPLPPPSPAAAAAEAAGPSPLFTVSGGAATTTEPGATASTNSLPGRRILSRRFGSA